MTDSLSTSPTRIDRRMKKLKGEGRPALVTYFMGGDPDYDTSLAIMRALPRAGADIIELGMPFSDPMADGPAIQAAGLRALKSGQTLARTLQMAADFRKTDDETPIVMMGYYNPIYIYGVDRFLTDAKQSGVDGLIVVDLPPEMDTELCIPAINAGVNFIRMVSSTASDERLKNLLGRASGFVYCVTSHGPTGLAVPDPDKVEQMVARVRAHTPLPVCVGFGIKTPNDIRVFGQIADGLAIGTEIVRTLERGVAAGEPAQMISAFVADLRSAAHAVSTASP